VIAWVLEPLSKTINAIMNIFIFLIKKKYAYPHMLEYLTAIRKFWAASDLNCSASDSE